MCQINMDLYESKRHADRKRENVFDFVFDWNLDIVSTDNAAKLAVDSSDFYFFFPSLPLELLVR